MRIAFDYQTFFWQTYGGISRYFVRLAEKFLADRQDVGVFAPVHRNGYVGELPASVVHGYRLRKFPPKSTRVLLVYNHLMANRSISVWKPDVVHETYYLAGMRTKPRICPTVVTVHDMIHELFPEEFLRGDPTPKWKRDAISRADHVICVSESTRRDLIRLLGTPEEKISVVHHGIESFSSDPIDITKDTSKRKMPFILYVGNRGGYKNFSRFLKAVSTSRNLRSDFNIVAFGGTFFSTQESALIHELGFRPEQVRQLGGGDEVLGRLYDQARAFVYPSLYEGFGFPPLEAMAHGCPVVSSNTSSMPEVIGDAGEYFDPYSADSIIRAIERVVYADGYSEMLVQRGIDRVKHFSWEQCADNTLAIYRKLQRKL